MSFPSSKPFKKDIVIKCIYCTELQEYYDLFVHWINSNCLPHNAYINFINSFYKSDTRTKKLFGYYKNIICSNTIIENPIALALKPIAQVVSGIFNLSKYFICLENGHNSTNKN